MTIVTSLEGAAVRDEAAALGAILAEAVAAGASVLFTDALTPAEAVAAYEEVAARVERGDGVLLAAYVGGALCGSVEVRLDTPPNQRHRAELSKLVVHRTARWRGLGRALVQAAEGEARRRGRTLLSLDTTAGSLAERLFTGLDYRRAGVIPGYALLPGGLWGDAVFFWKAL